MPGLSICAERAAGRGHAVREGLVDKGVPAAVGRGRWLHYMTQSSRLLEEARACIRHQGRSGKEMVKYMLHQAFNC